MPARSHPLHSGPQPLRGSKKADKNVIKVMPAYSYFDPPNDRVTRPQSSS